MAAANGYLREVFVPDYNARFGVPAAEPGTAFVAYAGPPLADVLCVQGSARSGATTACNWGRRALQIPPQRHRHHYVRATVRVHEYPDGRLAIFDGPRCLARCDPAGTRRPSRLLSAPLEPLGGAAGGLWTTPVRSPQPHRRHNGSSGHMIR